jgi:hypothetical protein
MRATEETTATLETTDTETFSFTVSDVTANRESDVQFDRRTPVKAVTQAIATRLGLPTNTPWALRSDRSSAYLDDAKPLGDQIAPGERVTVTPRAHLG